MPPQRHLIPVVCALLALGLVVTILLDRPSNRSSGSSTPVGTQQDGAFEGATFPPGVRAHDFTLLDQQGRSVSLSAYRGQVVALAFLWSNCRACVLVAQQIRGALDELEPNAARGIPSGTQANSDGSAPGVQTIFVSTDSGAPRARVGHFLEETSLSGRVEYLTGTLAQLRSVWHAYRIPPASAGKTASEAAVTVLLIDRKGFERVGFGLEQITPEGLAHDIRLLQTA